MTSIAESDLESSPSKAGPSESAEFMTEKKLQQANMKNKRMLEAEQRTLQSTLLKLRSQQRLLMIENQKLKRVWKYRQQQAE
uniref:BZIP domain-containing protein n=1 Tax=Panagrellus redivivus TaxID=6233 RepID=A0A7E4VWG3_PANRE